MTARVFFATTQGSRTGFAEIVLHGDAKVVEATAVLTCQWSE